MLVYCSTLKNSQVLRLTHPILYLGSRAEKLSTILQMMRSVIQEIDMDSKPIEDRATQASSCDVHRAKLDIDYLTVSDTTNKAGLSSTDLNKHRRLLGQLRKCGGQATIFKALKF